MVSHKKMVFLDAHLPPPPAVVKQWAKDNKKKKKNSKKQKIPVIPAKEVRNRLRSVVEKEIPALQAALQTSQFHRECDARIVNATIGDLLSALNVKQIACKMKQNQIEGLQSKISTLSQEVSDLNKELNIEREKNQKWDIESNVIVSTLPDDSDDSSTNTKFT